MEGPETKKEKGELLLMRTWEALSFLFFTAFLLLPVELKAQAPMRGDPEKLLSFAHHLREKQDLYRAEGEYTAFLILFPQHPKAAEAWFFLGRTRQQRERWEGALEAFLNAVKAGDPNWSVEAGLAVGETLLAWGRPVEAAQSFQALAEDPFWERFRSKALWSAARAWLAARNWGQALAVLRQIRPEDPEAPEAHLMASRIETEAGLLPRRSEWVAGGLSALLPGAGHLYAGRPWEALTSFFLNFAFLAGSVWSVKEGCLVSSGILSFLELSWYLGGIESAAEAARRYNNQKEESWIRELGQTPASGMDSSLPDGIKLRLLGFRWRF